jgi:hypothetical protein
VGPNVRSRRESGTVSALGRGYRSAGTVRRGAKDDRVGRVLRRLEAVQGVLP